MREHAPFAERGEKSPRSSLNQKYLREIGQTALLTAEDEITLGTQVQNGLAAQSEIVRVTAYNKEARRQVEDGVPTVKYADSCIPNLEEVMQEGLQAEHDMILANLRLVVTCARRIRSRGLEQMDLVQLGNLGLMRAVQKFDHRKGFRFSTYATWKINQSMRRGIQNGGRIIRVPQRAIDRASLINLHRRLLSSPDGTPPTNTEVAELTGISEEIIQNTDHAMSLLTINTLDAGDPGERDPYEETPDLNAPDPEDTAILHIDVAKLQKALGTLNPRHRDVIEKHFGLGGDEPKSLQEIGDLYGLSRERIRQLKSRALELLRQNI